MLIVPSVSLFPVHPVSANKFSASTKSNCLGWLDSSNPEQS